MHPSIAAEGTSGLPLVPAWPTYADAQAEIFGLSDRKIFDQPFGAESPNSPYLYIDGSTNVKCSTDVGRTLNVCEIGRGLLGDSAPNALDPVLALMLGSDLEIDDTTLAVLGLVAAIQERSSYPNRDAAYLGRDEATYWTGINDHKTMWRAVDKHQEQLGVVVLICRGSRDEVGTNGKPVAAEWDLGEWPDPLPTVHPSLYAESERVLGGLEKLLAPRNALWDTKHGGRTSWRLLCRTIGKYGMEDRVLTGPAAASLLGMDRASGSRSLKRLGEQGLAVRRGRGWCVQMGLLRELLDGEYDGYVLHDRMRGLDASNARVKAWLESRQQDQEPDAQVEPTEAG